MASKQLRKVFVMESEDRLQQMEQALLQLEKDPTDKEAINVVFRAAHTVKGSAGVVGFDEVSHFMHTLENTLDEVRSGNLAITGDFIGMVLACHDFVVEWLSYASEHDDISVELAQTKQDLLARIDNFTHSSGAVPTLPPENLVSHADTRRDAFRVDSAKLLQRIEDAIKNIERDNRSAEVWKSLSQAALNLKNIAEVAKFEAFLRLSIALHSLLARIRISDLSPDGLEILRQCHTLLVKLREFGKTSPEQAYTDQIPTDFADELAKILRNLQQYDIETANSSSIASTDGQVVTQTIPVAATAEDNPYFAAEMENWHISLRFRPDALRKGVEPLETLHYLGQHGTILHLSTLFDTMPQPDELEPDACYVGCELGFKTNLEKHAIESLFELIEEDCEVRILPPHSQLNHYIDLIRELPEDTMKLGEILLQIGTLTKRELNVGLNAQEVALTCNIQSTSSIPPLGQILIEHGVVQQDVVDAAVDKQQRVRQYQLNKQRTLHVDALKLDQLIDLVGELVITNASMKLLSQDINDERLKKVAVMMSRLVEEIRNRTLGMRMVPIGDTFKRFNRLVRDLCDSLDKKIDLQILGAETELDKSMVEKIGDPLMHLIRNAIDHGIESTEQRVAEGKPPTGILQLNAYHDSGSIVIEVIDDGRGMNVKRILASAIEKGLAKKEQEYTEAEILNFIFEPGLSTAETVTQVSGRGVGLDVVKRNISALNGVLNVDTELGVGTTIQIYLPLTLAIIDGFLLTVGGTSFVLPLDRVVRCVKYTDEYAEESKHGYINLRGKVLPLLHVDRLFGLNSAQNIKHRNIVVSRYGTNETGLVVDELHGEFQAVIKPLGKIFEQMPGISGATILGNGEVALILDVPALVQRYTTLFEHEKNTPIQKQMPLPV